MPTPFAPHLIVSHKARTELQALVRASSTPPSLGFRARIVLRAAAIATPTNRHISRDLGGDNHTVGTWRRRSLALGFSGLQEAIRPGRPRRSASSPRVQVIAVASTRPPAQERPVTRGTLEESVATLLDALHTEAISRASLWRLLHDVALQPHKRAYGLHSHDEALEAKAHTMCPWYAKALASYAPGRLGMCCDAKTGRQVLERKTPTHPAQPGRRERREPADIRHGTRVLLQALAGATGPMAWTIGTPRKATDCVAHLPRASQPLPRMAQYAWVMDTLHTPGSLDVCRLVAQWCTGPFDPVQRKTGVQRRAFLGAPRHRHVLHCTPKHGAWLNQAALFVSVLPRRFVARGSLTSAKDFDRRLERFLQDDAIRHAHPYRWTYTGEPCVRDTPLSRTRRQQRQGRACLSPRPNPCERLLSAPRPSRRQAASLGTDLRNALLVISFVA
jgi:transposase